MEMLKTDIATLKRFFSGPFDFIDEDRTSIRFYTAARQWIGLVLLLMGFVALATYLNYDNYLNTMRAQIEIMTGNPVLAGNISPWRNVLVIPLMGLSFIMLVGLSRHLMVRMLGEIGASMAQTQAITIYTMLPMTLIVLVSAAVRIIFPEMPAPGKLIAFSAQEVGLSLALLATLVLEMLLCIKALRIIYKQHTGRAILTYLAPMILCNLSCVGFAIVFAMILMGQAGGAG